MANCRSSDLTRSMNQKNLPRALPDGSLILIYLRRSCLRVLNRATAEQQTVAPIPHGYHAKEVVAPGLAVSLVKRFWRWSCGVEAELFNAGCITGEQTIRRVQACHHGVRALISSPTSETRISWIHRW